MAFPSRRAIADDYPFPVGLGHGKGYLLATLLRSAGTAPDRTRNR